MITIIAVAIQNLGNDNVYCLGPYSCDTPNKYTIFLMKLIYVIFWTWLLNIICAAGYITVSWVLVLVPYILMLLLASLVFLSTFPDDGRYTSLSMWAFF